MVVIREKKAIFKDEKDVLRNVRNIVTTNQFRHIPSVTEEEQDDYLEKLVEDSRVEVIRDDLVEHYPDEVMRAFTSKASREKLTRLVQEEQRFGKDDEGQKKRPMSSMRSSVLNLSIAYFCMTSQSRISDGTARF